MASTVNETVDVLTEPAATRREKPTAQRDCESAPGLSNLQLELYGLVVIVLSLIMFLALLSYDAGDIQSGGGTDTANWIGPVGAAVGHVFLICFGLVAFLLIGTLAYVGVRLLRHQPPEVTVGRTLAFLGASLALACLLQLVVGTTRPFAHAPGGLLGLYCSEVSQALVSGLGTALIFGATLLVSTAVLFGRSLRDLASLGARLVLTPWRKRQEKSADEEPAEDGGPTITLDPRREKPSKRSGKGRKENPETPPEGATDEKPSPGADDLADEATSGTDEPVIVENEAAKEARPKPPKRATRVERAVAEEYRLPDLELLSYEPPETGDIDREQLKRNARRLEEKLADFNVKGNVVQILPGPVVTMYEFQPAPGVKISRIQNLTDDLTMALASQRIRVIAPIPGKGVVGIEVPNRDRETVYLKEVLDHDVFREAKGKLTIALGKDIMGNPTVTDLARAPHLLVAGATGSGKSVAVNSFILSLLFRRTPDEVKLILVDPKMIELTVYQGIPHLLLPVVTDPKEAATALKWAVLEMERRYRLMSRLQVRSITSYNQAVDRILAELENRPEPEPEPEEEALDGVPAETDAVEEVEEEDPNLELPLEAEEEEEGPPERLPYIVVIIDELADLMMAASKDVETSIARLAQKARAAGIHLVLATQRPSVNVITGLIKANFPTRISFQVASKTDSRTVLDQNGADALLGMGDMLFLPPGTSRLTRNHGAFVSDDEVKSIVEFIRSQRPPEYDMDILKVEEESGPDGDEEEPYDELFDEAVAIVAESRQASISYLQRRLKIGYNRAARIVERMEREGMVGPSDGSKPREVYVNPL